SCRGRGWRWRSHAISCARVKGALGAGAGVIAISAPDNHLTARRDGGVIISGIRRVDQARRYPAICRGIVSATGVKREAAGGVNSAPNNHVRASPDGGVIVSPKRRV